MDDSSSAAHKTSEEELLEILTATEGSSGSSASEILAKKYDIKDLGDPDTLCNTILQMVAEQKYDRAILELQQYQAYKNPYPQYEERTSRYFEHAVELINAIRSKKSFPSMASLPISKQQELDDRVREHFNDLKRYLQRVSKIEQDLRVQDARSTIWVFQTFLVCVAVIFIITVTREAFLTLGTPVDVILEDFGNWIVDLFDF